MFKKLMLVSLFCAASVSQVQSVDLLACVTSIDAGQAGWNDAADDDYERRQTIYSNIHGAFGAVAACAFGAIIAGPVGAVVMAPGGVISGKYVTRPCCAFGGSLVSRIAQSFRSAEGDEAKQEKIDNAKKTTNRLIDSSFKSACKGFLGLTAYLCVALPVVVLAASANR